MGAESTGSTTVACQLAEQAAVDQVVERGWDLAARFGLSRYRCPCQPVRCLTWLKSQRSCTHVLTGAVGQMRQSRQEADAACPKRVRTSDSR